MWCSCGFEKPTCDCLQPVIAPRAGDWMQTYSGRQFWPLDPRADEVRIWDIAAALSKLCRYGGHSRRFYSVAEHCVLLARSAACPPALRLVALMHDASEAYVTDIIRPIKPYLVNYAEIEDRNMIAIAARYGFAWPMPAIIKDMDNRILADERDQAMTTPAADWNLQRPALGVTLQFWTPDRAMTEFVDAFLEFGGRCDA